MRFRPRPDWGCVKEPAGLPGVHPASHQRGLHVGAGGGVGAGKRVVRMPQARPRTLESAVHGGDSVVEEVRGVSGGRSEHVAEDQSMPEARQPLLTNTSRRCPKTAATRCPRRLRRPEDSGRVQRPGAGATQKRLG